jgi:ADP-ribose pyrophosphatase
MWPFPPQPFVLREPDPLAGASAERPPFLSVKRATFATAHGPLHYDWVERAATDAAILVCWRRTSAGLEVLLRSSPRVPVFAEAKRRGHPQAQDPTAHVLWELPAGLIEPSEAPQAGAVRELHEETGLTATLQMLRQLGAPSLPAPALIGERHFYFAVETTGLSPGKPSTDGSPLEQEAQLVYVTLEEALHACDRGDLPDTKTELGIRRFAALVAKGAQ